MRDRAPRPSAPAELSRIPGWVSPGDLIEASVVHPLGGSARVRVPTPPGWAAIGAGLRTARRSLAAMPIARIVGALDEVSRRWGSPSFPPRKAARDEVAAWTGFSAEAVDRSFDVELRNYRKDSLVRVLRRELGDPEVLDRFVRDADLRGARMAVGPEVTLAVLTGNVPALPALSLVRALLVKSAVVAKVASGEPTFAARFAQTIDEVDPVLGACVLVTYWPRDDRAALRGALGQADAVIGYGGDEACAALRAELLPHQRYVEHGHKISVGIVSAAYLARWGRAAVADQVAEDVGTFDQHACIAPQAYLVEGSTEDARAFAAAVAGAAGRYAARYPSGAVPAADAASLQVRRAAAAWRAATEPGCDLWSPSSLAWAVSLETDLLPLPGGGHRVLRVVPVPSLQAAVEAVAPLAHRLQNVGLGAVGRELEPAAAALARVGACRLSQPGRMSVPSMMWHHDGEACVAALVRWCDLEMHPELSLPARARALLRTRT